MTLACHPCQAGKGGMFIDMFELTALGPPKKEKVEIVETWAG